jgi:DNA mismatch repair protein MutS
MAGMPRSIVERATSILSQLEQKSIAAADAPAADEGPSVVPTKPISQEAFQLSIFETVDPVAGKLKAALKDINLNSMTPIECMLKLNELVKMTEED